jgi:hypothetical protein
VGEDTYKGVTAIYRPLIEGNRRGKGKCVDQKWGETARGEERIQNVKKSQ